jgi:hypothetical protein
MKSYLFLLISLLAMLERGYSQNLVPNGSFETFSQCPYTGDKIYFSNGWFQPNKVLGLSVNQCSSSDYYNSCDSTLLVSIPMNYFGFQFARTGDAYIGLALYTQYLNQNGYREYAEVKLNQELDSGKKYNLKYYVSMANNSRYSITKFDAHFSNDSLLSSSIDHNSSAFATRMPEICVCNAINKLPFPKSPTTPQLLRVCSADALNYASRDFGSHA